MSVVRIRRQGGKVVQDCDIYIGRLCVQGGWNLPASKWANPFTVNLYGREEALKKYEQYIREMPDLWDALEELEGKRLGCWCVSKDKTKEVCHGEVLLRLLEEKNT